MQSKKNKYLKKYSKHTEHLTQEAKKQGIEQGIEKEKIETVKRMIQSKFDEETISNITGLSIENIKKIREEMAITEEK